MKQNPDIQLDKLQKQTFRYFWNETSPVNGLTVERTSPDCPASIAATGLALTSLPVGVERGFIPRDMAAGRALATLRFFMTSRNGPQPEATGYRGFYYKYLDMNKGRRAKLSELSFLDSSILFAGMLAVALYFDKQNKDESEIRYLVDELYRRADWFWAMNGGDTVLHGWKPEHGFLNCGWKGYDEGMIMYILGLGSPTSPLPENSYTVWTSSYEWISSYGHEFLYSPPFLVHQLPHIWIDFRGIRDHFMQTKDLDYFGNSIRASLVQYQYALENPMNFDGYGRFFWGITTSDGPGPALMKIKGNDREFYGYARRGVPFGPDDGTISPWAAVAALPFVPEIVLPTIEYLLNETDLNSIDSYGFKSAFNPAFSGKPHNPHGWRSPWHFAANQGPALALIENYRTGFLWELLKESPYIRNGLSRAGFSGGWLEEKRVMQTEPQVHTQG